MTHTVQRPPTIRAKHACPVNGCNVLVGSEFLMCREHWRLVPVPLQRAVYKNYRHGGAAFYLAARDAAIKAVNAGDERRPE